MGAYQKLNLKTLQDIVSVQLRCFRQEGTKKFVFCLRDFDEAHESLGDLESTIRESMAEIWAQIKKPEPGMKSKDVYSIEVVPFRSFRIDPKGFREDCARMRRRLEAYRALAANNLPLDGFVEFLKSSWEVIQSNKDLNIPDQKRIVANVRCKEEAHSVFAVSSSKIAEIRSRVSRASINGLVLSVKQILASSFEDYDRNTTFYDEAAKKEHKEELRGKFSEEVRAFVKASFDAKAAQLQAQAEVAVKSLGQRPELGVETFNDFHQQKLALYLRLDEHRAALRFEAAEVDSICREKKARLLQTLKVGLGNLYVKILDALLVTRLAPVRACEDAFHEHFGRETFEAILREAHEAFEGLEKGLLEVREEDPALFSEMNADFFASLRTKVFGRVRERLEGTALVSVAVRAFKRRFAKDAQGVPRKWRRLQAESINALYRQERAALLEQLKFLNTDLRLDGVSLRFRSSYAELRDAVESELEALYNAAMDKHFAGNALQGVPKVG